MKLEFKRIVDHNISGFHIYNITEKVELIYFSQNFCSLINFSKAELMDETGIDYLTLIHPEDREVFMDNLSKLHAGTASIEFEYRLLRKDRTPVLVRENISIEACPDGSLIGYAVLFEIENRQNQIDSSKYYQALANVYDTIFECDRKENSIRCIHSNSFLFGRLKDIPMQYTTTTEKFLAEMIVDEDRNEFISFIKKHFEGSGIPQNEGVSQITYAAYSSSGTIKQYIGTLLYITESTALYCVRKVPKDAVPNTEIYSDGSLYRKIEDIALHFTDGAVGFEVSPDRMVTPLYASSGAFEFFGITKEEWMPLMQKSTPLSEFVANSKTSYDDFEKLLDIGEATFTYFDYSENKEKNVKAICSPSSSDISSSKFIMLYKTKESDSAASSEKTGDVTVSIRTFGFFEVFVDEKPIAFRNQKSKELLALLVDRRGGYLSSEEAIGYLWEDEPASSVTLSRYRKVALRLKNTLDEYGISDIVDTVRGKRRIIPEKVNCDYYDYLSGKEEYSSLFKGSYLSNYSWGETTLAELSGVGY